MIRYENRRNEGVDPETRRARLEFRVGAQLAKTVIPHLMPPLVYNRLAREGNLVLESPLIHPLARERPGDPASKAVDARLPVDWKLESSKFVVQNVEQGRHHFDLRRGELTGLSWLFELQTEESLMLGKVVHGSKRPIQPERLRLGVALRRYSETVWRDVTDVWSQEQTNNHHEIARKKLHEMGKSAYILGNPAIVDINQPIIARPHQTGRRGRR